MEILVPFWISRVPLSWTLDSHGQACSIKMYSWREEHIIHSPTFKNLVFCVACIFQWESICEHREGRRELSEIFTGRESDVSSVSKEIFFCSLNRRIRVLFCLRFSFVLFDYAILRALGRPGRSQSISNLMPGMV